jgi:hypothetical protein
MTRFLYLVRHGAADPHDGPLSAAGREQARLTGERLRDVPFSGICHGPLPRAAQTAELIAASLPGVPVCADDLAGDYLPSDPDPAGLPPSLLTFNDAGHLSPELRWTGFPPTLRPDVPSTRQGE